MTARPKRNLPARVNLPCIHIMASGARAHGAITIAIEAEDPRFGFRTRTIKVCEQCMRQQREMLFRLGGVIAV